MKTPNLIGSLAALVAATSLGHAARAATLMVTSLADSGAGSLREQIANAANGDTINFQVTGTITLTSGQLVVSKDLKHCRSHAILVLGKSRGRQWQQFEPGFPDRSIGQRLDQVLERCPWTFALGRGFG